MSAVYINIVDLGEKTLSFSLGSDFLRKYSGGLSPEGIFSARVGLVGTATIIEASFYIQGTFQLTCDRSLRSFSYPVEIKKKMIFKYGDEDRELSEGMMLIDREKTTLEIGQFMYDWIGLSIPIKKLHPDCSNESEDHEEGKLVYSTSSSTTEGESNVNPVWKKLIPQNKRV